jgi:hypothetical protein
MTAVAEGFSRGPSQIVFIVAVLIAILSMKGMAGDAYDPALVVKNHIRRDLYGRDRTHGMRPHFIGAVVPLMARVAYSADLVAERQGAAGEGKADVAFDALHLQGAVMRAVPDVRRERGERGGQDDPGDDHCFKAPIRSCID